jgi:homoserine dehydrogenase
MVELTPQEINKSEVSYGYIRAALKRGKHAITANKATVAWRYKELKELAIKKGAMFMYEATVMDGMPLFNMKRNALDMCEITEIKGILNRTTNYMLDAMMSHKDKGFDEILEAAKQQTFIEADPKLDIEGYDAAAKITALLNVLMDADITPDMVDRKGIEDITVEDIKAADQRGNVIKLLCKGTRAADGTVIATVKPEEVPNNDMLASIDSTTSVVSITTDLMKKVSVVEHQPEIEQTAYGVFGDMLRVLSE